MKYIIGDKWIETDELEKINLGWYEYLNLAGTYYKTKSGQIIAKTITENYVIPCDEILSDIKSKLEIANNLNAKL